MDNVGVRGIWDGEEAQSMSAQQDPTHTTTGAFGQLHGGSGVEGCGPGAGNWASLLVKTGQHGQVRPKGLFPCCEPL